MPEVKECLSRLEIQTLVNEYIETRKCPHGCDVSLDVHTDKETFLDDLSHHVVFCRERFRD